MFPMKDAREALHQLLQGLGLEERVRGFAAAQSWAEIAGPAIARVTAVVDFQGGRLTVEARGATVMQEVQMLRPRLIEAFAKKYGPDLVRDIHVVPGAGRASATGR